MIVILMCFELRRRLGTPIPELTVKCQCRLSDNARLIAIIAARRLIALQQRSLTLLPTSPPPHSPTLEPPQPPSFTRRTSPHILPVTPQSATLISSTTDMHRGCCNAPGAHREAKHLGSQYPRSGGAGARDGNRLGAGDRRSVAGPRLGAGDRRRLPPGGAAAGGAWLELGRR